MTHDEYLSHDATGLAERVQAGEVQALELLEIAIARVEALNPAVNAVVYRMYDEARAAAATGVPAGPFTGVPFLAKDLLSDHAGHPTTGASRLREDIRMPVDSELVRRVRAAGSIVMGKTNLPEWGIVPFTESEMYGTCSNPWDLERTPGGSSGGSAAAVAAGIVPMAGGGDGGGSIRIPASCCGLFGMKPTRGRTPTGPTNGLLWRGATVEHVLTRSVRDSAAMLDATRGPDAGAPTQPPPPDRPYAAEVKGECAPLRIGWTVQPFLGNDVHPDCVAALHDAVELLESLGHSVEETTVPMGGAAFSKAFLTMVACELAADIADVERRFGKKASRSDLEAPTWALALLGRSIPGSEYAAALRTLERTGRDIGPSFERYEVVLTPTLASPPPRHGTLGPTKPEERLLGLLGRLGSGRLVRAAGLLEQAAEDAFDFIPWTPVFNATGQPAMSVPLHWNDDGLPIGVHLVGRFADEGTLFRLAAQLERARPWFDRLPELARSLG